MKRLIALLSGCVLLLPGQEPKRPRILGVAHMALYVSDIEKSRAFYKDYLGFEEPFHLNNTDGSLFMAFIKVNDHQYVELSPGFKPGADRLNHVAIYTDDAEAMRAYLAAKGVAAPAKVGKGRIGNSNFNVKDPDGHTVEIVQYEPAGWSMREKGKYMSGAHVSEHMLHVGIIVGDLAKANAFYADILGFREFWRGSSNGTTLSWTNMRVPDGSDYIEFMLYKDEPAPDKRGTQHHICLEVPDAAKTVAALEAKPARKLFPGPMEIRVGRNQRRQVNLFDPDGTRVEVMESHTVDGNPPPSSTAPPPR